MGLFTAQQAAYSILWAVEKGSSDALRSELHRATSLCGSARTEHEELLAAIADHMSRSDQPDQSEVDLQLLRHLANFASAPRSW